MSIYSMTSDWPAKFLLSMNLLQKHNIWAYQWLNPLRYEPHDIIVHNNPLIHMILIPDIHINSFLFSFLTAALLNYFAAHHWQKMHWHFIPSPLSLFVLICTARLASTAKSSVNFNKYKLRSDTQPVNSHIILNRANVSIPHNCPSMCSGYTNCLASHVTTSGLCTMYGPDKNSPGTITVIAAEGNTYIHGK